MLEKKTFYNDLAGNIGYWLYTPDTPSDDMPLILFLHGAGESGNNLDYVCMHGIPKMIAKEGLSLPAYAIFPQCPGAYVWPDLVLPLKALIDSVVSEYKIDKKRIHATGLSMGGFGTWALGRAFPNFFASLAPICGGGLAWAAGSLKMPIRAFHGDKDSVVSLRNSVEMVDAVNANGGNATLTIFPDTDHDSWNAAYEKTDLIEWILAQKKV